MISEEHMKRFTDNGDQTVTDNLTGLMWTKDANQGQGTVQWTNALNGAADCNAGGYNDWRLPSVQELHSLVDYGRSRPALPLNHPFLNIQNNYYWSSNTYAPITGNAWTVHLYIGFVDLNNKVNDYYAWYCRGGSKSGGLK